MTCILVAHLGDEVIIAADKRVTQITEHGARIPCGDNEEKIVRTEVGIITGAGSWRCLILSNRLSETMASAVLMRY